MLINAANKRFPPPSLLWKSKTVEKEFPWSSSRSPFRGVQYFQRNFAPWPKFVLCLIDVIRLNIQPFFEAPPSLLLLLSLLSTLSNAYWIWHFVVWSATPLTPPPPLTLISPNLLALRPVLSVYRKWPTARLACSLQLVSKPPPHEDISAVH